MIPRRPRRPRRRRRRRRCRRRPPIQLGTGRGGLRNLFEVYELYNTDREIGVSRRCRVL